MSLKKLKITLIILFVLVLATYFGGNYALERAANKFTAELLPKLEKKGVHIEQFGYGDISIISLRSIKIKSVDLIFKLKKEEFGKNSFTATFNATNVILSLSSITEASGTFNINNFSIYVEPDDKRIEKPFGKIENGVFRCGIPFSIKQPEKDAAAILREVENLFQNNSAQRLELSGDVQLGIDGKEVAIGLTTVKAADSVSLQFNKDDIIAASKQYELGLTDKEAEVIAHYPSKVPAMLRITREAKHKSQFQKQRDHTFPEDAYRHIYWSYHLTRTLGKELSKEITDAHETAPGNTQQERLMDYHNNAAGRELAKREISEQELLNIVLTSKDIIRNPGSVRVSSKSN